MRSRIRRPRSAAFRTASPPRCTFCGTCHTSQRTARAAAPIRAEARSSPCASTRSPRSWAPRPPRKQAPRSSGSSGHTGSRRASATTASCATFSPASSRRRSRRRARRTVPSPSERPKPVASWSIGYETLGEVEPMRAATTTPAAFDMRFVGALTPEALKAGLEDGDGLITFVCPGEEEFVRAAREAGEIMLHRDSDERGVTRVRLTPGRDPTRDIGLTTATLDLHSDRPATQRPPQVLLLWCRAAAGTGGESILVQADAAVAALAARDP